MIGQPGEKAAMVTGTPMAEKRRRADARPPRGTQSLLFMKPSSCSRLVKRLKIVTKSVTVAIT